MGNKQDLAGNTTAGSLQILQASLSDPNAQLIAASLSAILGLGFSAWSYFSDKRNKELFDNEILVRNIIKKIDKSDDFASFVFDVWQKHNLESSEERRKMLKKLLVKEVSINKNDFENFSKIEHIIQNANLRALKVLLIFYSDTVRSRKVDPNNAADRLLNVRKLVPFVQKKEKIHEQDIEYLLNELSGYGLVSILNGRWDGPFYEESRLGFVFVEYLNC